MRKPFGFGFSVLTILGAAALLADEKGDIVPRVSNRPVANAADEHPLKPAIAFVQSCQTSLQKVSDYEATFSKRELVGGRLISQTMTIKLREEPFSVYLYFSNPHQGREVIYNAGRNQGKLQVHETGLRSLVGTISLPPDSPRAMAENRYPVTMIGLSNLVAKLIQQWQNDLRYNDVDVKYYPNAKLAGMECQVIQSTHQKPKRDVQFAMTRLYIDKRTQLPVRVEQYGFASPGQQPPLIEEYTYTNVRPNIGLTDADFDVNNPKYDF